MKFVYKNPNIKDLDCIQEEALNIYGRYDLEKSLIWMTEEFGELIKAIHKNDTKANIQSELGDLMAWILCISNILEIHLSDSVEGTIIKEINRQLNTYHTLKYTDSLQHLKIY